MFSTKFILNFTMLFFATIVFTACSDESTIVNNQLNKSQSIVLDVYKSPTCGCCKEWITHINDNGLQSKVHSSEDFSIIKDTKGIAPRYRSCHTAVAKQGYVFEGHVPAKYIQQFLKTKHADDVIGLSVPGMPLGSPGMEVDDKFQPYRILLLKSDGTYEIYANVQSYEEQF